MCSITTDQSIPLDAIPLRPDSVLTLVDDDGIIKYSNASVERVLEYDRDELVGEHFTGHIHPDDCDRVSEMLQALTKEQNQNNKSVEYRHRKRDGTYERLKSVGSPQPVAEGWYLIRTSEAADQGKTDADIEAREEFDKFAKVVSHDLRNPLNVASGHVELLYNDIADQDVDYRQRLKKVMCAHDRMETLIENLLTLARSGKEINAAQWIAFDSLCQRCWQNVSTANAQLVIKFDGEVRADPSRLQQLVENLIRNAIEHGGEDVTVTIGETGDGDAFYVADDGTGIPEAMEDQVFQNGFSTVSDGTGFGLAIVSEIADAHGWKVEVAESQNGGARFDVTNVDIR
ncbi:PAS domain-containing sensor histidine kinase [Halorubrum ejinorense]|uniref:histidine kinase n=1 Tax=Halorubrum ejinorense TaxID=425309 RepID=A0AAV3SRT7_9EURY